MLRGLSLLRPAAVARLSTRHRCKTFSAEGMTASVPAASEYNFTDDQKRFMLLALEQVASEI